MKKTLSFTYDPIYISKLLLEMYVERYVEGKTYKAKQFAHYEYLRTQTDEECDQLMVEYAKQESLEVITFEDWTHDCEIIIKMIETKQRFKDLLLQYQRSGFGATGKGVVDKTDNTFYDCNLAEHWQTVGKIIESKYNHLYDAFLHMSYGDTEAKFYKDVSRDYLDDFILSNFEFTGSQNGLESYLN